MQSRPPPFRLSGLMAVLGMAVMAIGLITMLLLAEIRFVAWGLLALGAILLAFALIMDFRRVSATLTRRQGRLRFGTSVMASIFLAITILANAISITNYQRFDTTSLGQFTLTDQTKDMLAALREPVEALAFYEPGDPIGSYAANLLTEYESHTNKLSHRVIDPVVHPDQARRFGIGQFPAFVFQSQERRRVVLPQDVIVLGEEAITFEVEHPFSSALLEVTEVAQKKVYFLTGHGEHDINSDYRLARKGLLDDLYLVGTLNLITAPAIPADTAALIIAAPKTALSGSEVQSIDTYLKSGGQVLILTDPDFPDGLNQIVSAWGIDLENGMVIDPASNLAPRKDTPVVSLNRNAFGLPTTYFPGAIALVPRKEMPESVGARPLLVTSTSSWLEKEYNPSVEPTFDEGKDVKGPLSLGILIAAPPPAGPPDNKTTRLVVIGDSDFASSQHIVNVNNGDLFLNSVAWLAEETQLITIRRNVLPFRQLVVDPSQANFMRFSSIVLLPLLVLLIGGIIWWRRR
ncbi:MAG: GldG family protein [Chloroflexi bacterium]|nr:GldG family protein [Chloroflexota bacterium]